jgi:hypothetical protein
MLRHREQRPRGGCGGAGAGGLAARAGGVPEPRPLDACGANRRRRVSGTRPASAPHAPRAALPLALSPPNQHPRMSLPLLAISTASAPSSFLLSSLRAAPLLVARRPAPSHARPWHPNTRSHSAAQTRAAAKFVHEPRRSPAVLLPHPLPLLRASCVPIRQTHLRPAAAPLFSSSSTHSVATASPLLAPRSATRSLSAGHLPLHLSSRLPQRVAPLAAHRRALHSTAAAMPQRQRLAIIGSGNWCVASVSCTASGSSDADYSVQGQCHCSHRR